ncbi:MAG: N-acetylglucosaminyltransferase [Richelia sp. RM2_1_2]|nr:N-acetylglucosaminyltransferase [Richelia sp. SM2_1_7]NJM21635.1 N-acetylglucosaminyltransferase [Richelia sp. SM1_7_0]NJN08503.1 N-acetylglucosaminyltransferase [Richelia sp. RM1_1_1]NJO30497.1 N-acetylglucosaminyltransferase [Richelia sp. SL_2_1]NJO57048.1 N-acetylglucosaminyltransferase [Richelia sp. RM2_1_2]
MKICYLIQTHQNAEQIYRLIETIQTSGTDNQIIISHDFTSCNLDTSSLENNGVKILTGKGGRGDFLSVQSYLNAVKWLIDNRVEYDWLIYLSGQDYPIKPISKIESFLSSTDYDGFLEYFPVFSSESHWSIQEGKSRYLFEYRSINFLRKVPSWLKQLFIPIKIINYLQPFFRINLAYEMFGVRRKSLFNQEFICYGGSFFTTLSRKCVEYLHYFCQKHPEVVEYYQKVCVSDESFIQTILLNSRQFNLCDDNKRYFDFSKTQNGRPKVLTINDYDAIMESNAHFARKFDICKDEKILDILDNEISKVAVNR